MKRYCIYWKIKNENGEDVTKGIEIIASSFKKALDYCVDKVENFNIDTVDSLYTYKDILLAD